MTTRTHDVQFIAITFDDKSVAIMQFILDPNLDPTASVPGYDHTTGRRAATDETIAHEIRKSSWGERRPVSFRRIRQSDVPVDRSRRLEWRDHGTHIGLAKDTQ